MTAEPGGATRGGAPDWERVKQVLADALERPAAERADFLSTACGGDEALRAEVESLLPDEETERGFLARPVTDSFRLPEPEVGETIGCYRIVRTLGEGGMGRVYEATQERPHRTVALKVMRPGFLSGETERRFEWEVEALGRLNHPAIAKVYDAGIEELGGGAPLPWFAMELVDGRPLLEAADALGLDRRARLELFAEVCDGVAHAHQRGVIHRDLKPDNVLVDAAGKPHVLDFGIARAADPIASSLTTAGEIVGTLAYMSPEQLLGQPERVDARADVYALGVLLYRLLTGRAPLELQGLTLPQVVLRHAQQEATPAGRVDRTLRGDLETILATALAHDAERRYASVERLAADVRRTLADEPITARPATTMYQLVKFARRNRGLAGALAATFLLLVAAVAGTSVGMVRASRARALAERQRERAEIERDRTRAANRVLDAMFASPHTERNGRDVRVVDVLGAAGAQLAADRELEPPVRASLHMTLGKTYRSLGLSQEAAAHLARATELFEQVDGRAAETTIEAKALWIEVCYELGESAVAEELLPELEADVAALADPPAWVAIRPLELASARAEAAGERERRVELARAVYRAWLDAPSDSEGRADSIDTARNNLAVALLSVDESTEAEALLRESLAARAARMGERHPSVLVQRLNLAVAVDGLGRTAEAVRLYEELLPLADAAWGPGHEIALTARNNYAAALEGLGRYAESFETNQAVLEATRQRYGNDDAETVIVRNNLAVSAMHLERFELAEEQLRRVLDTFEREPEGVDPVFHVRVRVNLASALSGQGRLDEALELSRAGLESLEELAGEAHVQTLIARNNHLTLLLDLGRAEEAVVLARRNIALAQEHQPGQPMNVFPFRTNLGKALLDAGDAEEAVAELEAAERALEDDPVQAVVGLERCRELLEQARAALDG